jgi:hypothetical protein
MSRLKFRRRAVGGKARSHYDIGRVAVSGSFPGSFEDRQCLRAVASQRGTAAGIPQCPDALEVPCTGCSGDRPRRDGPARSPRHAGGPRYALAERVQAEVANPEGGSIRSADPHAREPVDGALRSPHPRANCFCRSAFSSQCRGRGFDSLPFHQNSRDYAPTGPIEIAGDLRDATTLPIDPNALLCWQLCDGIMSCEPEWDVVLDVACKDREVVLPGDRADCQICEPCRVPDASCPIR